MAKIRTDKTRSARHEYLHGQIVLCLFCLRPRFKKHPFITSWHYFVKFSPRFSLRLQGPAIFFSLTKSKKGHTRCP
ncbi:Hypothetical protein Minf_2396 [Methylacidiphilum infernorum V4]|uniref:Uncharacterized protein n=1 Tax=Methylacidiphilum infernorum (isolate V4) TaxID=481448 RepID=B3E0X3_METI4|nr:Hypothetical protein Minf_2396 [Methylacidiphilum infernorum V4]